MARFKTRENKIIETKDDVEHLSSQIVPKKDVLEERFDIVSELLLSGQKQAAIERYCNRTLMWGVTLRTIAAYIAEVRQRQRAYYDSQMPTLLKDTANQYDMLYRKALKAGAIQAAAKILQIRYEMINGKPIQETRELSKQEQPSFTIVQVVDGKEQKIDLRIDKKESEQLPPPETVE